jgi:poly-beta-1,6-N-acetyl-D-glucosamine synthase
MLFIVIFILTISLCFSSYLIYPLVIYLISKTKSLNNRKEDIYPSVSIIIPAYNEARYMESKIQNSLSLEYPQDKIEILIGSDGSTDNTADIVKKYKNIVSFVDFPINRGKTAVQNDLVDISKGEILVFTDAACFLAPDAIKKLVRNFADKRVGCVAGRMNYIDTDKNLTTKSQGLYWQYEIAIRMLESKLGNLIGVDGPLYAVHRHYYIPLADYVISDLITPLLILEQGKKVVMENEAIVYEDPTNKPEQEFNTRRRITLRGLIGISANRRLINPFKYPIIAAQIFFHKILRWFVGPLIIINGISCMALSKLWFFNLYIKLYILFFLIAALGWALENFGIKFRLLVIPYYFSLVNFAATMGIIDFIRKKRVISWVPVRK